MCVHEMVVIGEFGDWSKGYSHTNPTNGLDVSHAKLKKGEKSNGVCSMDRGSLKYIQYLKLI